MEIEALEAILMDDFKGMLDYALQRVSRLCTLNKHVTNKLTFIFITILEIHSGESGLNSTTNRCFQIKVTPQVLKLLDFDFSLHN